MKFKIGTLIEAVATLAVGFACSSFFARNAHLFGGLSEAFDLTIRAGFVGVAFAQCVSLGFQRLIGRPPIVWGWGRSCFCLLGLYHMAIGLFAASDVRLQSWHDGNWPKVSFLEDAAYHAISYHSRGDRAWIISAFLGTTLMARHRSDDKPDAVEWSGRAFALMTVVAWTIYEFVDSLRLTREPWWGIIGRTP